MKSINKTTRVFGRINLALLIVSMFLFVSCEEWWNKSEDFTNTFYQETDLSITQYLEVNSNDFSILNDILDTTGLNHLFKTYGDYTFLAPTNSAFEEFFKEKGKSSYTDFETDELKELIKYHVFSVRYLAGSFNMGIVQSLTLSLDRMVTGPSLDGSDILLNKQSKILSKNIDLPNGIVHSIDKVLEKPELSIVGWLNENKAQYSIFLEAIEKTGLDEVFNNDTNTKEFYSGFITSDTKYAESNINSFTDLAQKYSPDNTNYADPSNLLRALIASHFTTEIISMSDATEDHVLFGTVGGATTKIGLIPNSADIVLNYNTSDFPKGLNIDEFNSNNLVSNGIIHVMDTMFQTVKSFERVNRLFIFPDVPGIPYDSVFDYGVALWEEQGVKAKESGGELGTWAQFWPRPGEGIHLPFEDTEGWLTLNAPYSGEIRLDHHRNYEWADPQEALYGQGQPLFFTMEFCADLLDVTRKFGYIIPGKYKLIHYTKCGNTRPTIEHYFDGKPIGGIKNLATLGLDFQDVELGVVEIKEGSTEHFLRIKMVTPGKGFYVAIKFEPID